MRLSPLNPKQFDTANIGKAWAWIKSSPQDAYVGLQGTAKCAECGEGSLFCEDESHPKAARIEADAKKS